MVAPPCLSCCERGPLKSHSASHGPYTLSAILEHIDAWLNFLMIWKSLSRPFICLFFGWSESLSNCLDVELQYICCSLLIFLLVAHISFLIDQKFFGRLENHSGHLEYTPRRLLYLDKLCFFCWLDLLFTWITLWSTNTRFIFYHISFSTKSVCLLIFSVA